jgi:hypothetical protein
MGAHMMAYPISKAHTSRAYVSPSQPPSNLVVDQREVDKMKRTRIAKWGFGASRLIETAEKVVKVCRTLRWRCDSSIDLDLEFSVQFSLYDRLGLRSWHKGRIVLLKAVFLIYKTAPPSRRKPALRRHISPDAFTRCPP